MELVYEKLRSIQVITNIIVDDDIRCLNIDMEGESKLVA